MTLYLYKIGTEKPVLTVENAQSYTADSVTAADGTLYPDWENPIVNHWRRTMNCPARRIVRRLCEQITARRIPHRKPV